MFEKDKKKSDAFAFFKNPVKKPHVAKRILNGSLYAIINMIKWNMLTLLTLWTIAFAFFGVDYLFFADAREKQQVIWQHEQNQAEEKYAIELDNFTTQLIEVMKSKKSLIEIQQALQTSSKIKTTLMTNNIFEFSKHNMYQGSEEFLVNFENNKPVLFVRNINDNMEQSFKKLEKDGKISLKEVPYNEYRKTLEVRIK